MTAETIALNAGLVVGRMSGHFLSLVAMTQYSHCTRGSLVSLLHTHGQNIGPTVPGDNNVPMISAPAEI